MASGRLATRAATLGALQAETDFIPPAYARLHHRTLEIVSPSDDDPEQDRDAERPIREDREVSGVGGGCAR